MNKLLTGDVWGYVIKRIKKKDSISAAISYVTSKSLPLKKGDVLICDGSPKAIASGVTSAKSIKYFHSVGVKVYSVDGLHAKVLITKHCVVIGSANLSENSKSLVEASLYTTDESSIAQAYAFISPFILDDSYLLKDNDIEKLMRIPVSKRSYIPNGKPKHRNREFGNNYWIVTTKELKHNRYDEEIEQSEKEIASELKISLSSVSTITWPLKSSCAKDAKSGDIVIQKFRDGRNTYVYFPAVIVRINKKSDCIIHHLQYIIKNDFISWTKFERRIDKTKLNRQIVKNSNRHLSRNEYKHLENILR